MFWVHLTLLCMFIVLFSYSLAVDDKVYVVISTCWLIINSIGLSLSLLEMRQGGD